MSSKIINQRAIAKRTSQIMQIGKDVIMRKDISVYNTCTLL